MGVLGHYVGDSAQPLHTTKHYNGWSGQNPKGYTSWNGIHAWIDGGLAAKAGIRIAPLLPQVGSVEVISLAPREDRRDPMFVAVFDYLRRQHTMVEPLYLLEKEGKLGQAEGAVVSEALAILNGENESRVVTFGYSDDEAFAVGLTCGGIIHLFIQPLTW